MTRLLTVRIARDEDVVVARQRARQVADALGFDPQQQTRVATAVSEIARNVARYAGTGTVEFALDLEADQLVITTADRGRGIADIDAVLGGRYRSATGMGLGIIGARRMMDGFDIRTSAAEGDQRQAVFGPGCGSLLRYFVYLPRLHRAYPGIARTAGPRDR
jgi:anti-sigma regulatory factor (Ser/Thr protein kinase)